MPRRRMIDPDFWDDSKVKLLSVPERLLFLGMISHADDYGRLQANPAYLRSKIFPYDDFTLDEINSMRDRITETNTNIHLYTNGDEEYLAFRKWSRYQKPSHPQDSKLPSPPELQESYQNDTGTKSESDQHETRTIPSQSSLGQSSLGLVSLGQSSAVPEDFTEFSDSQDDLTDFLTTTLKKHVSAAAARSGCATGQEIPAALRVNTAMPVLQKCWSDIFGGSKMPQGVFDGARKALKEYPVELVSKAFAKGLKYKGGKHKSWKYFQAILEEESRKGGRGPPR